LTQVYRTFDKMAIKAGVVFDGSRYTENPLSFHTLHNGAERKNQSFSPGVAPSAKTKPSPQKYRGIDVTTYEL